MHTSLDSSNTRMVPGSVWGRSATTTTTTTTTTPYAETVYMKANHNNNNCKRENSIQVLHNVSAMPQYAQHSLEELRWQDYCQNHRSDGDRTRFPVRHKIGTVLEYVAPETLPSNMVMIGRGVPSNHNATTTGVWNVYAPAAWPTRQCD